MPFYVSDEGELFVFKIKHPMQLELSNGVILPDPPPNGQMFAVERSARKYAELIKDLKDVKLAKEAHTAWVRGGGL